MSQPTRRVPRGIRNHNPGNVKHVRGVRWQGARAAQTDPVFVQFDGPEWGIRAIARTLITYQDKRRARDGTRIDTIREIVERWAPATENNTNAYVRSVTKLTDIGADETLDVYDYATMRALVRAIIRHENGQQPYDDATIDRGLALAGIKPPALVMEPAGRAKAKQVAAGAAGAGLAGTALAVWQEVAPTAAVLAQSAPWLLAAILAAAALWFLWGRLRRARAA